MMTLMFFDYSLSPSPVNNSFPITSLIESKKSRIDCFLVLMSKRLMMLLRPLVLLVMHLMMKVRSMISQVFFFEADTCNRGSLFCASIEVSLLQP